MESDHHSDGESVEKVDSLDKGAQHGTWESDFSDVSSFDGYSTDSSWKPYRYGNLILKREKRLQDSIKAYGKTGDTDWMPYRYAPYKTKTEPEDIGSKPPKKRGRPKKEVERVQKARGPKETVSESSGSRPSSPAAAEDMSGDDSNQKVIGSQPPKKRGRPKKAGADRVQKESVPEDIGSKPPKKRGRPKKAVAEEDLSDNESNQEVSGNRPSSPAAAEDMSDDDINQKRIGSLKKKARPKKAVVLEEMSDDDSNQEGPGSKPSSPAPVAAAKDMSDDDSSQKPIESKSTKKGRGGRGRPKKAVSSAASD